MIKLILRNLLLFVLISLCKISFAHGEFFQDSINQAKDTLNERKSLRDLYGESGIRPAVDLRSVDGLFLGLSYKTEKEGLSKEQYKSKQKITALHSLSTRSFILSYEAEWKEVFKKTDLTIDALADMDGNIQNFFGSGNDTYFDQSGDFRTYYRVNYSFYKLEPALEISLSKNVNIKFGPSFQYFNDGSNQGRYIESPALTAAYPDLHKDKAHGGLFLSFNWDKRNNILIPTKGMNFTFRLQGYEGLNSVSKSFAQFTPSFSFYKALDKNEVFVIANRIGAGFTIGKTAFYQQAYLGSQDNLLGFRKFRFAGDHLVYNNLEARINLPNVFHSFMPGKVGLIGFYDAGRVWVKNENSNTIHHGYGGGVYMTPFNRLFVRAVAGFSKEGLQPTVTLRQRF